MDPPDGTGGPADAAQAARFDTDPFAPGLDGWQLRRDGQDLTATTQDPTTVRGFLAVARRATRLHLDDQPKGIPLDWLVAALGRMEEIG